MLIDPKNPNPSGGQQAGSAEPKLITQRAIPPDTPLAKVLYSLAEGNPLTIIDSPPGAGKTTLVVNVLAHLGLRDDILPPPIESGFAERSVAIGTPTRKMATDLAIRARDELERQGDVITLLSPTGLDEDQLRDMRLKGVFSSRAHGFDFSAQTIRRLGASHGIHRLIIADEAYQMSYADFIAAAYRTPQVLMVGDPGQIGPISRSSFANVGAGAARPGMPAPIAIAAQRGVKPRRIHLPSTYRFGTDTVNVIEPLYDFGFDSRRPDAQIIRDGVGEPEISTIKPGFSSIVEQSEVIVDEAVSFIGSTYRRDDTGDRIIDAEDIAIVVAHRDQVVMTRALLNELGFSSITVDTANKLQGGQWPVVIAVDPMNSRDTLSQHHADAGRLCVMLSRHEAHLSWFTSPAWKDQVADLSTSKRNRRILRSVRLSLDAHA